MSKTHLSLGRLILQLALGLFLAISGIWVLAGFGNWSWVSSGDAGAAAIKSIIQNRTLENILVISYGVVELIAGIFLILSLFIGDVFGAFGNVLHIIIMIVWIVAIVLIDFLSSSSGISLLRNSFLKWLYQVATHLIILGALIYLKD
jgi:hypothetical protein